MFSIIKGFLKINNKNKFLLNVSEMRRKYPDDYECEWCGMRYPPNEYPYRIIKCRNMLIPKGNPKTHIICEDCYDRLEPIK